MKTTDFHNIWAMCNNHVNCNDFYVVNGFLFKNNLLCIPRTSLRESLIKELQSHGLAGHFGMDKTLQLLNDRYYWPQLQKDVNKYVKYCFTCQTTKGHKQKILDYTLLSEFQKIFGRIS